MIFYLHQKCAVTGLGIGERDYISVETYGNGGNPDDRLLKDPEPGLHIMILLAVSSDILPALLKAGTLEDNLVF